MVVSRPGPSSTDSSLPDHAARHSMHCLPALRPLITSRCCTWCSHTHSTPSRTRMLRPSNADYSSCVLPAILAGLHSTACFPGCTRCASSIAACDYKPSMQTQRTPARISVVWHRSEWVTLPVRSTPSPTVRPAVSSYTCSQAGGMSAPGTPLWCAMQPRATCARGHDHQAASPGWWRSRPPGE